MIHGKKILVVAAHPDDEVIGCGGSIAKHVSEGAKVHVLLLGDGVSSRSGVDDAELKVLKKNRYRQAIKANRALGSTVELEKLPDNRLDSVDLLDIAKRIEKVKVRVQPEIVYTHYSGDLNVDHRITSQAVLTAFRPQPGEKCQAVFFFEVSSSTEWQFASSMLPFRPQYALDISAYWKKKEKALQAYATEMRAAPHPRSISRIKTLAEHRGSIFGLKMAEVFETGYMIR